MIHARLLVCTASASMLLLPKNKWSVSMAIHSFTLPSCGICTAASKQDAVHGKRQIMHKTPGSCYLSTSCLSSGVVGFPNVGKSSLLNSLKRTRVAQVGNTPGVTRAVQEVVLDKHLRLLDSPGIVFADSDSTGADAAAHALRNCVKVR
jgi:ribosome biogenesis GTPase A